MSKKQPKPPVWARLYRRGQNIVIWRENRLKRGRRCIVEKMENFIRWRLLKFIDFNNHIQIYKQTMTCEKVSYKMVMLCLAKK